MEGLFFLIFIGFIIYLSLNKTSSAKTGTKPPVAPKASNHHDVPDYLKQKWDTENKSTRNAASSSKRVMSSASRTKNLWNTTQNANDRLKRRSDEAQERNNAQTEMFLQSGKGEPIDKNNHRRADWGKKGHLGGGWVQPILISFISALALAGFFAVS